MDGIGDCEKPVGDWSDHVEWAESVARAFVPFGLCERGDLYQVARIELWRAWNDFDRSMGYRFRTYAKAKIKGAILHAFRDTSGVPGYQWERGTRFIVDSLDYTMYDPPTMDAGFDTVELLDALDKLKPNHKRRVLAAMAGYDSDRAAGKALGVCRATAIKWREAAAKALAFLVE